MKFSDHWKNELLGGWSFSGITTIQSGEPMTFTNSGLDVAVDGTNAPQHAFRNGAPIAVSHPNRNAMVSQFFRHQRFRQSLLHFHTRRDRKADHRDDRQQGVA